MHKDGWTTAEIAAETGRPSTTVAGVLWRARRRGELPPKPNSISPFMSVLGKHEVKIGSLGPRLAAADAEVASWVVRKVSSGGYADIAEFAYDLFVEAFYEEKEQDQ